MISRIFSVFTIVLVLAGFQTAFAQYSARLVQIEPENVAVIYNNGEFRTGATTESGGTGGDYDYAKFGIRAGTTRGYTGVGLVDIVLPDDFDGDGKADIAVYRAGDSSAAPQSYFYIINSSDNSIRIEPWGLRGDIGTMPGDYDGDGKTDIAVFRKTGSGSVNPASFRVRQSDGSYTVTPWATDSTFRSRRCGLTKPI